MIYMSTHEVMEFFTIKEVYDEFEAVFQDISKTSHISPSLVREYTKKALLEWEDKTDYNVLTLMKQDERIKKRELTRMLDYIGQKLRIPLDSEDSLDEVMSEIAQAFKHIYHL